MTPNPRLQRTRFALLRSPLSRKGQLPSRVLFGFVGIIMFSTFASAFPRTWVLSGVTLTDGGMVVGSFTYDADTNTYSNISIATTTGAAATGATYNFVSHGFPPSALRVQLINASELPDLTGKRALAIGFSGLNDVVTGLPVTAFESQCDATCSAWRPGFVRWGIAGGVNATTQTNAIPTLSAPMIAVLALALVGAGFYLLRR